MLASATWLDGTSIASADTASNRRMHLAARERYLALSDTAIAWPTLVLNPVPNHHYERGQHVSRQSPIAK